MLKTGKILSRALLLILLVLVTGAWAQPGADFDQNRARLLGHMIQQQLSHYHYSKKPIDDNLSYAAFDLYMKQLDFQKRFLLKEDVAQLDKFQDKIDDSIRRGRLDLPELGRELLNRRIGQVRKIVDELLGGTFDFQRQETLQTDPKKIDFAADLTQLRDRWRKILKFQILSRYLNLREDEVGVDDKGLLLPVPAEKEQQLLQQAQEKVGKSIHSLFDRMLEETMEDHYDRYLNAIARAFDPHTDYLPPTTREDFEIEMRGSLEGIGATLREEDGYIKVVKIIPGSAAYRQGQLSADDIILKVAQGAEEPVDITDTRIRDAVALIRGKKGTEVRLTVKKPDGRRLVIPIVRDVVEIEETFVKGTTIKDDESGKTFGYVKIPSFYRDFTGKSGRNCTDDLRNELRKLKKENIAGLILDLRNNGGGSLPDAVSTTGLFIKTGPVVQVRNSSDRIQVLRDDDSSIEYSGPMIVLVNRFSASASEIFAGALQDYGRALIVGGEHTHGKGTVQQLIDLDRSKGLWGMDKYMPLGVLKVTIQKFYRISGESTQEKGVTPDVILPSRLDGLKSGEKYLDYALPWDHIASAEYQRWKNPPKNLVELQQLSHERVAHEEQFNKIVAEANEANLRREQTKQSLLLSEVLKERDQVLAIEGPSPHGGMAVQKEPKDEPNLDKVIADDPYVKEGTELLQEMINGHG